MKINPQPAASDNVAIAPSLSSNVRRNEREIYDTLVAPLRIHFSPSDYLCGVVGGICSRRFQPPVALRKSRYSGSCSHRNCMAHESHHLTRGETDQGCGLNSRTNR